MEIKPEQVLSCPAVGKIVLGKIRKEMEGRRPK
jgi:hypothetical protein